MDDSTEVDAPKLIVAVDQQKAALLGVSQQSIVDALSTALSGADFSYLHAGNMKYPLPIRLEFSPGDKARIDDLLALKVRSQDDVLVPVAEVVRLVETRREHAIYHKDLLPMAFVSADMAGDLDFGMASGD